MQHADFGIAAQVRQKVVVFLADVEF